MNDFIFSRKIILSFFALLVLNCFSYAQNSVTLVFTGKDQHGLPIKMNGITIQNLSRNWQETLLFPDTVYTLNIGTGIDDIQEANEMKVMPNPFDGRTRVNIFSTNDENAKMVLVDINGKTHARYEGRLTTGDNFFDITLMTPQTYILSIQTQSGIRNLKMVNIGHAGSNRISFVSNIPKAVKVSIKSSSSHDFELGDEMQYIGFAQIYNHITQSTPIRQVQFTSEEIELVFNGYRIEVSTDSVFFADNTTFVCYGTVNTFGFGTVQTGFCWGTQPNPTLINNHISSGMTDHSFTSTLTGMNPISNYYVRAYATNGTDTAYGENIYCLPTKASFTQTDTAFIPDGVDCGNGCIYGSSVEVFGFAPAATIHNTDDILYARLKLEHTYIGDLYVALTCPPDPVTGIRKSAKILKKYNKYNTTTPCSDLIPSNGWGWNVTTGVGSGADFGAALHTDSGDDCNPNTNPMGTAWNYCWSNNAANGYQYTNGQGYVYESVNQGHHLQNSVDSSNMTNMTNIYHPDESFASLIGCPINGTWSINIIDSWYGDNGWITEWEIAIGGRNSTATAETDSTLIHPCQNITTVTDFDGNVYHTVAIGNQCWLRENMRTTHYTNGEEINIGNGTSLSSAYYYMPEDLGEDSIAGYLYNWTAVVDSANQGATGTNNIQGICPYGWHIPSDAEWHQLTEYLSFSDEFVCGDNSSSIAKSLAAKTDWNISNNACAVGYNPYSNNSTSFSAFPAGNAYGFPYDYGKNANYWTSTAYNNDFAYYYNLNYNNSFVERNNFGNKCNGLSVRCIRNKGIPIFLPSLSTFDVSQITEYSALCGGDISSTGGAAIIERGICWSTSNNPTINDNHIIDNSGLNTFSCTMMNLAYNTTYYVRAYAINDAGIAYGEQKSFSTPAPSITVTTSQTSDISCHSATSGGNITAGNPYAVNARGVCWSTSPNPTIANNHTVDGSGNGSFTSNITGLQHSTTYHVRAYAIYYNNDTIYGEQQSFVTPSELPTVTTATLSDISYTTASCGGEVTNEGITTVTARGICWNTSPNPTTNNNYTTDSSGMGSFSSSITGLQPNTRYYVRAYATNSAGTAYGTQRYFNTLVPTPTVSTSTISDISYTSATCGGEVTNEGFTAVTARGVCWSTSQNPSVNDSHTVDSSGAGSFTSTLTGLQPNTTYYVRAYVTNNDGTVYGEQRNFTTLVATPSVTTASISDITCTTATCGGNVTYEGISAVTERGVCWSASQNPTINDSLTVDSSGLGNFTSHITGLQPNTHYYVRAYAANSAGTVYGAQRNFTTLVATPSVTTASVSDITRTTATCGGNVTYEGISAVTERGVCWSTSQNPTISDSLTVDSSGLGSFTSLITGLQPNTRYCVRAYATNSEGTVYGTQQFFYTLEDPPIVTTDTISNITFSTALCGGNVTSEGLSVVIARGVCWSTSQNPTTNDNLTIDSNGLGDFTSLMTGLQPFTRYYVRAYATNSTSTGYGNQVTFVTHNNDRQPCIDAPTVTDIDSNIYNTIQIGQQCWMKENLRTTHWPNGFEIPIGTTTNNSLPYRYCPNNDCNNVPIYGYLYTWPAIMNEENSSTDNPSGIQGICPAGWHIPSIAEWTQLKNYVSSQSQYYCNSDSTYISKALCSTMGWYNDWNTCNPGNNPSANNTTDFSILPAGGQNTVYWFSRASFIWSCTQADINRAHKFSFLSNYPTIDYGDVWKYYTASVRCLRD